MRIVLTADQRARQASRSESGSFSIASPRTPERSESVCQWASVRTTNWHCSGLADSTTWVQAPVPLEAKRVLVRVISSRSSHPVADRRRLGRCRPKLPRRPRCTQAGFGGSQRAWGRDPRPRQTSARPERSVAGNTPAPQAQAVPSHLSPVRRRALRSTVDQGRRTRDRWRPIPPALAVLPKPVRDR